MAYKGIFGEEGVGGVAALGDEPIQGTQYSPHAITPIKLNEDDVKKTLHKWYHEDTGSVYRTDFLKRCQQYHQAYLGHMPETNFPWANCSNVDLGIVEMSVDNISARFKMSTLGGKPAFSASPLNIGAEQYKGQVQELMSAALDQQVEIEKKVDRIAFETVELGNCVVKRRWAKERKNVRCYEKKTTDIKMSAPFMNIFNRKQEQVRLVVKEHVSEFASVEVVNLEDIIVPENSPEDPQDMHHIMHRFELDDNQLEMMYSEDSSYDKETLNTLKAWLKKKQPNPKSTRKNPKIKSTTSVPTLTCVEVYCKWKHDDVGFAEEVIITWAVEANIIMRKIRLIDVFFDGKRPFRWFRYKSSGHVYGRGVVEMLYPYRTALNNVFNMAVNCMMLQILPWGFYKYGSSFKPEDHRLAPGVWIPLDDINDARPASFPPTARLADGAIALLIQLVERQSGISAPHTGQSSGGRKTAFEIRAVIGEGNIKHEDRIDKFKDTFADLLQDIYNLYKFNLPDNSVFRKLYDEQGLKMKEPLFFNPPSRYVLAQYDYDFIILGTLTTGNKAIERQEAMELGNALMQYPIFLENLDGQHESIKELLSAYGKRNTEKYLFPDNVMDELKQHKLEEMRAVMTGTRDPGTGGARRRPPTAGRNS